MPNSSEQKTFTHSRMMPPEGEVSDTAPKTYAQPKSMPQRNTSSLIFKIIGFFFKIISTLIWAIFHFSFCFLLQISELISPFLLILGLGWSMVPYALSFANKTITSGTSDPQTQDLVHHLTQSLPLELTIANHHITPHILIFYGLALMALASLSATICAWLGRRL